MSVSAKLRAVGSSSEYLYGVTSEGTTLSNCVFVLKARSNGNLEVVGKYYPTDRSHELSGIRVNEAGTYAYVLNQDEGRLIILSLADPENPAYAGNVREASYMASARGEILLNETTNTVYVLGKDYITAIDVSDPAAPVKIAHRSVSSNTKYSIAADFAEGLLFTSEFSTGITSYDVSVPTSITQIDAFSSYLDCQGVLHHAIDTEQKQIVLGASLRNKVTVLSYTAGGIISKTGEITSGSDFLGARDVALDTDREIAFACIKRTDTTYGISAVDYSDPASMTEISFLDHQAELGKSLTRVWYHSEWKLIYAGSEALDKVVVVDVSNPSSMEIVTALTDVPDLSYPVKILGAGGIN